ncbi:hypothetical protein ES319_A04G057700v1 [Gossypium barbadense]|uniref:Uncharacterized protein n=1 Tax=Gossypium barbadense TaxID=3634 RepID=A0A5J5W4K0_GOSBA|nr:hypothetical protein ES319_A04G057700v1 [Gossypium barbadense]
MLLQTFFLLTRNRLQNRIMRRKNLTKGSPA